MSARVKRGNVAERRRRTANAHAGRKAAARPPIAVRRDPDEPRKTTGAADGRDRLIHRLREAHDEIAAQNTWLIEMQRELEESRDRYHDLFDFAPVGFASLDENGVVQAINLAACRLFGIERPHLLERPLVGLVAPDFRRAFLEHLRRCRQGFDDVETELSILTRSGEEPIPIQLSCRASRDRGSVRYPTAFIDLRDRLRLERDRLDAQMELAQSRYAEQQARRDSEAKDRWLAVLSHELRTPLTPVVFGINNLMHLRELSADARRLLGVIKRNTEIELHLIEDLLDMNRISIGKLVLSLARVDLHDLVRSVIDAWEFQTRAKGVELSTDLQANECTLSADIARMRQVLWNLTTNAVKFTPAGGRIVVRSRNVSEGTITLTVSDSGVGFPPEAAWKLFEPFEQADQREVGLSGLGLGLTISKGIVEAHGGRIAARSEGADLGATFEIELPLTAGHVQAFA